MPLKFGELPKKTGLSIRALHHYDAIGLLSPSQRTAAGARLYGRDDLIRLQRIEALKQLACSLLDIKATLDTKASAPFGTLRSQIAALNVHVLQAQRLGHKLQHLLDRIAPGGETETAAADHFGVGRNTRQQTYSRSGFSLAMPNSF